jgi:hypothetical protein
MNRLTDRRLRRSLAALALAVAATTLLSSCRPDQGGAAALVGDDTISVDELQSATQDYLEVAPDSNAGDIQEGILQRMLISAVFASAAENLDVSVTDGQVAGQLDQLLSSVRTQARAAGLSPRGYLVTQLGQGQTQTVVAPSQLEDWVRDQMLLQGIVQAAGGDAEPGSEQANVAVNDALLEASRELDVEVNPRYGRWNPRNGVEPLVGGGLSKTVGELKTADDAAE